MPQTKLRFLRNDALPRGRGAKKGGLRAYPLGKGRREGVNVTKRSEKWDRSAEYRRTEDFQVILHIFFHNF